MDRFLTRNRKRLLEESDRVSKVPSELARHTKKVRECPHEVSDCNTKTTQVLTSMPEGVGSEDEEEDWSVAEGFSRPIPWQKIEGEGLDCDYGQLFRPKEATELFEALERELEYFTGAQAKVQVFGKTYDVPRKQATYGDKGLMYSFSGVHLLARPWTPTLGRIRDAVTTATGQTFNFVLVNRYKDGSDHMGEHRDDERELDPTCPIASVSLGAPRDFIFRHASSRWVAGKSNQGASNKCSSRGGGTRQCRGGAGAGSVAGRGPAPVKLELAHGSLLLMNAPTNTYWYHSLPIRKRCLLPRINLTFRRILKKM